MVRTLRLVRKTYHETMRNPVEITRNRSNSIEHKVLDVLATDSTPSLDGLTPSATTRDQHQAARKNYLRKMLSRPQLQGFVGLRGTDDFSITLLPDNLQANQRSDACARDQLPSEHQKSYQNGKVDNASDHNQAPSASGTDLPETRRCNQSSYPANALTEDATDERVWYAPIPNDISS